MDVATGNEVLGEPVDIQATIPGQGDGSDTVTFHGYEQRERAGLVLANGIVYTSWASYCDNPAHGWILGYDAKTLQQEWQERQCRCRGRAGPSNTSSVA